MRHVQARRIKLFHTKKHDFDLTVRKSLLLSECQDRKHWITSNLSFLNPLTCHRRSVFRFLFGALELLSRAFPREHIHSFDRLHEWPFLYYRKHYPSGRTWAKIRYSSGYSSLVLRLSSVVRRSSRTTEDSSSRRIMRLVPVFTLMVNNQTNDESLPKFVQTHNASSSIKTANDSQRVMGKLGGIPPTHNGFPVF